MPIFPKAPGALGGILLVALLDLWLRHTLSSDTCNTGIAFGLSMPQAVIQSASFLILLIFFFLSLREKRPYHSWAFLLIFTGGALNFLDRLLFGCVRDYMALSPLFPSFNLADMMLFLGVGAFLLALKRERWRN